MKKAKQYIQKRRSTIGKYLKTSPKKYNAASFHGLRVEIKKLKALLDVLEAAYPKFDAKKMYRPFKLYFKSAGRVRERQLEASILKDTVGDEFPKSYQQKLTKQIRKEKVSFFKIATPSLRKKLKKRFRALHSWAEKLKPFTLQRILDQKKASLFQWSQKDVYSDWDLHEIRKELKSLRYLQSLTDEEQPVVVSPAATRDFTDLLGEWHDLVVLKGHLTKFSQNNKSRKKEVERMQRSEAKLDTVIKGLHDQILEEIPAMGK